MYVGATPYLDGGHLRNPFLLIPKVLKGFRPTIPPDCPAIVRDLMTECWQADPTQRPSFTTLSAQLGDKELQEALMTSPRVRTTDESGSDTESEEDGEGDGVAGVPRFKSDEYDPLAGGGGGGKEPRRRRRRLRVLRETRAEDRAKRLAQGSAGRPGHKRKASQSASAAVVGGNGALEPGARKRASTAGGEVGGDLDGVRVGASAAGAFAASGHVYSRQDSLSPSMMLSKREVLRGVGSVPCACLLRSRLNCRSLLVLVFC